MSDLISRSELIEEIKSLSIVLNGKQIFSDDAKDTVLRIINEQPTAYNIDKDGVSDDMCEWKLTDTRKVMPYKTSCGNEDLYDNSYKYCPYCGKKILCKE